MEGPQFSTRAESHLYRSWGCDIVNMSALPESKLAREAEIAYQMICMATDYDCWREGEEVVDVASVIANLGANSGNASRLLLGLIPAVEKALDGKELKSLERLKGSMRFAGITDPKVRKEETVEKLRYILPDYF